MQRPPHPVSRPWLTIVSVLLLILSGCATKKGLIVDPAKPQEIYDTKPVFVLTGRASYYYGRWIGRLTANGETYRAGDVTAAHKTLPFNTMVRVTNLKNGKSVIVRINNRGPYVKGRILDLSLVAAQRVEMTQAGVVPVRAEILRKIEVVPKIKPKATEKARREAEKNAAQAALAKPKPTPTPAAKTRPKPRTEE
jgi:rare lipoprotein A